MCPFWLEVAEVKAVSCDSGIVFWIDLLVLSFDRTILFCKSLFFLADSYY